ncbi:MAG: glutamine synthetase III [Lachnospiraceae bacterium]|jgi:glutamine synthetase|nr:glutamine synthetase III [Lachnospiraceae bacterium]
MGQNVIEDVFAKDVFNDSVMRERLPKPIYKKLKKIMAEGQDLDMEVANAVAHAMKEWALERGATHYTHWFQPMTGITAEKHDSFIQPAGEGGIMLEFSGKELVKGESDASSFPNGGIRDTCEARGYTTWDCTSPAFLKEDAAGVILCIPTAFCSYTGEALDKKTPLLRSMEAISEQAVRVLRALGNEEVQMVGCSVGPEQEYFLVDRDMYLKREDLIFTGRTLFGAMPPKGQELDDHYFGTLKERVAAYMKELNIELWKLGILAKTQHNEVAPAQHELAPIYGTANIATDHNQLVMEVMKKVAKRHNLECLLHEKPFAGVNGSGKHDNWSLVTDDGQNLLDPGKTPHHNLQFLLFLAAVVRAVDEHAGLLRLSASCPGNDHRLGANEAPPAIISIFLGDQLQDVVEQLISSGEATSSITGEKFLTGVSTLPDFTKDVADRNRTSPFAFTGNKFEFRMVASSLSVAGPNTILNTIVADVLEDFATQLEKAEDVKSAAHDLIVKTLKEHQRVIFNGDGYSDGWIEEAERRGLPNKKTMVDAIPELVTEKTISVFEKLKVLNRVELEARAEIYYEAYAKELNIEAKTMVDMASKEFIPAIITYVTDLAASINEITAACDGVNVEVQTELLKKSSDLLAQAQKALAKLRSSIAEAAEIKDVAKQANFFKDVIKADMDALRAPIDELEPMVGKEYWPVPCYADLLFSI